MKFKKTISPNGLRIITIPVKDSPAVTVQVLVEAGSKYESKDVNGLSHFLEHMCFKGTEKRPGASNISYELDSIGSQYNAFTSNEFTGYYAKAHPKHVDKILDIVADMYLNPTLPAEEIEKEKGVIVEEINMYEDMPHRQVNEVFMELLYGDTPAGRTILGPRETVKSMKRDHFVNYRNAHYVPSKTVVVVSGNISENKIIEDIKQMFAKMPQGEGAKKEAVVEKQESPSLSLVSKDIDQAHLVLGVRAYPVNHKDVFILKVLNGVLGAGMSSRLFKKMRDEMGVCYYVRSGTDEFTDHGIFAVSAGVDIKRLEESMKAILKECSNLKTDLVSDEELEKVKECLIGNLFLGLETSDSLAEFYGLQEILNENVKTPEEVSLKIRSVTAKDIKRVANEIFVDKNLNFALISPKVDESKLASVLTFNQ